MLSKFIKHIITSQLIIYIIRCVIGFLIGYSLMIRFPEYELFWSLLSIILVISPEGKDTRKLTIERVKSNLIGSVVGLICLFINSPTVLLLVLGIVFAIIICYLFKVMNMSRVAIVAFLIIMLQTHTMDESIAPIVRFATVTLGCFIGLSVVIVTSVVIKNLKKRFKVDSEI